MEDTDSFGPSKSIFFKMFFYAWLCSEETCPTDQSTLDLVPIIVGSALAGLIVLTLVVYLVSSSTLNCLPIHGASEVSGRF